jgi:hypothetical protein
MPFDGGRGRNGFKDRLAEDGQCGKTGRVTPEELNALARKAAMSAAGRLAFPVKERFGIAWEAIAEELCSSADPSCAGCGVTDAFIGALSLVVKTGAPVSPRGILTWEMNCRHWSDPGTPCMMKGSMADAAAIAGTHMLGLEC